MSDPIIKQIAESMSENLCVQNGLNFPCENPITEDDLGLNPEGEVERVDLEQEVEIEPLTDKLLGAGFVRIQKSPEIQGYGKRMPDGRVLVIWDSDLPGEGQWSVEPEEDIEEIDVERVETEIETEPGEEELDLSGIEEVEGEEGEEELEEQPEEREQPAAEEEEELVT